VGTEISVAIMKSSLEFPQKAKVEIPYDPAASLLTPEHILKRKKSACNK
jgi:hypothetical protein